MFIEISVLRKVILYHEGKHWFTVGSETCLIKGKVIPITGLCGLEGG